MIRLCYEIRKDILTAINNAGNNGHPGGSFSLVEIITALYEEGYLNTDPAKKDDPGRSVLITGGSHSAALPQYILLSRYGFLDREKVINDYRTVDGTPGHPKISVPGVESNEGSLGMAIPKAVSFAGKKVYALSSDSDFQEGLTQEALAFAGKELGSNFVYIVNANGFSLDDEVQENYREKLEALGFTVVGRESDGVLDVSARLFQQGFDYRINGNDIGSVLKTYEQVKKLQEAGHEKPIAVIFNTVKGAGHKQMAGNNKFHAKFPGLSLEAAINGIIKPGEEYGFPAASRSKNKAKKVLGSVLEELAGRYGFLVLTADTGKSTGAMQVKEKYPERYLDVGCREQLMVSMAEGYALQGMNTISITFGQFLVNRAREQIESLSQLYEEARASTILIGTHNGLSSGKDDMSHHCINAYELADLPGMNVLHAADPIQLKFMVEHALQNKGLYYIAVEKEAEILSRTKNKALAQLNSLDKPCVHVYGKNGLVLATGLRVYDAVEAAENADLTAAQLPSIAFDEASLVELLKQHRNITVVEENLRRSGIGQSVKALMQEHGLKGKVNHLCIDCYSPSDRYDKLLEINGLDSDSIARTAGTKRYGVLKLVGGIAAIALAGYALFNHAAEPPEDFSGITPPFVSGDSFCVDLDHRLVCRKPPFEYMGSVCTGIEDGKLVCRKLDE